MNFAKVLRTPFYIEHLWWLLLSLILVSFIQKQCTIKQSIFHIFVELHFSLECIVLLHKSFPGPSIILFVILYLDCCVHISVNNEKKSKTKQSKKNISQNKHIIPYRARTALFPKSEFFFKFYVSHYLLNCLTFPIIINNFK